MSPPDTATLFAEVRALLHAARDAAARQVNTLLVLTNYEIGRRIVEHEQGGAARAEHVVTRPEEALKDPYVLEFLGLDEHSGHSGLDLEACNTDKLAHTQGDAGQHVPAPVVASDGGADAGAGWRPPIAGGPAFIVGSHRAWGFRSLAEAKRALAKAATWLAWVGDRHGDAAAGAP